VKIETEISVLIVRWSAEVSNNTQERFERDIMLQLGAAQNLARFLSRDADVAEDIVQEAFLQAYRGFQGYRGGDPSAWVFAIVRNCHRNWLKQRRRKMRLEVERTSSSLTDKDWVENVASDADTPEMTLLRQADSMAAAAHDSAEGIVPGISHRLRDQEEHRAKGDERTESAESSIHAAESGQSGEAEECRGAGPVARQSEAVLRGRKSAVGRVEAASGRGASCSPIRYAQRGQQDPEHRAHFGTPSEASNTVRVANESNLDSAMPP